VIAFLTGGAVLLLVGSFPPGSLKRVRTPMAEVEFADDSLAKLAAATAAKAPSDRVDDVFAAALNELGELATAREKPRFTPSPEQIEEIVQRVVESPDVW
jgi:hypothetical protein